MAIHNIYFINSLFLKYIRGVDGRLLVLGLFLGVVFFGLFVGVPWGLQVDVVPPFCFSGVYSMVCPSRYLLGVVLGVACLCSSVSHSFVRRQLRGN